MLRNVRRFSDRLLTMLVLSTALVGLAACGGGGDGSSGGGGGGGTQGATQILTVDKNGAGSGTVSSSPSGVQCGATCSGSFPQGTAVTLNAVSDAGSVFSGWGNVCPGTGSCTVTLNADMTIPANFSASQNFTLMVNKTGNGTVNSTVPSGLIQCGATCAASVAPNTAVTLTAIPDSGSSFLGWSGPCSGTGDCTVTVGGNVSVQANFSTGGAFDFSLSATPTSQLAFAGANVSFTISAALLTAPGSAAPVTLDIQSVCPSNATCTFTPNPVTPSATGTLSTLVVATASNTPLGPASLVVRGIGGVVTRTTTVQLRVVKVGASSAPPRFAYATNTDDDTLSIFTVNAGSGQLVHHGYVKTGISPEGVTSTSDGKFVYVANHDAGTISSFAVTQPPSASAGSLTAIGSAVPAGKFPKAVIVHPTLSFLYAVNFATSATISNGSVSVYGINSATGALTPISCGTCQSGQSSTGMVIDPAGKFAYVANYVSNPVSQPPISAFQIQPDGTLAPIALGNLYPNLSAAIAMDPAGKFLFTVDDIFNKVLVYLVDPVAGGLTKVQTVSTADSPGGVTVDPSGKFLYVANAGADKVSGYAINTTTGVLTAVPNSPFSAGTGPSSVTVDPSGNFLYATNLSADSVSAYSLDQGTGELFPLGVSRTRQAPAAMAITKGPAPVNSVPTFAYTSNQGSNTISEFSINPATGQLTTLGAQGINNTPVALAVTPSAQYEYVVANGTAQLPGFAIGTTGALTATPGVPTATGPNPQDVTVEPSGQFVYVANQAGGSTVGSVSGYKINQADGTLTPLTLAIGTDNPVALTADPTGQFLYVANQVANTVSGFTIDSGSGLLNQIIGGPAAVGQTPQSVAIDQSGQFLYVAIAGTVPGTVYGFKIQAGGGKDGQLVSIGSPIAAGVTPVNVAIDPSGKWVFVTNSGDGTLSVYRIDGGTGTLSPVSAPVPVGNKPDGVTVDPSGTFVYVTVWGPDAPTPSDPRVFAYALDPGTGLLTFVNSFPVGTQPTEVQTTGTIQ